MGDENEVQEPTEQESEETEESDSPATDHPKAKPNGKHDARIKKLSDESARYRTSLRKTEAELEAANAKLEEFDPAKFKTLQIENAFLREAFTLKAPLVDLEAAFKLLDVQSLVVDDGGAITGMDSAVERLIKRYPWLTDDLTEDKPKREPVDDLDSPSGAPFNKKKQSGGVDRAALEQKFPALRRGR